MSILDSKPNEVVKEQYPETDNTELKRFLSGNRIYTMLAVAIVSFVVFALSFATIIGITSNIKQSENLIDLAAINPSADLDGQYVQGSVYKFVGRLGYIAETERAATDYYYLMYLDVDGQQYAVLVQTAVAGDHDLQQVISAYLTYAKNPDAGYQGSIIEIGGRFKTMSQDEKTLFEAGLSKCAVTDPAIPYTLKVAPLPEASDTVIYYVFAVPAFIALVASVILFLYGLSLEKKREEANKSPYPYLNGKKKGAKK